METLISSLVVAGLTGLSFLAYKHPDAFKPIYTAFNYLSILVDSSLTAWNLAISMTYIDILPHLSKE